MSESASNRPQLEFRVGGITFTVWNGHRQQSGAGGDRPTVFLQKQSKDQTTGKWRTTSYFLLDELPKLAMLAMKAYEHFALRVTDKRVAGTAADHEVAR
jgi:hypothetical protein